MSRPPHRLCATLLTLALLLVTAGPASAQESARVSREREALRRAQAALLQTQAERDALVAEKASASKEREALKAQLAQGQATQRSLQARSTLALAEVTRLQAELATVCSAIAAPAGR